MVYLYLSFRIIRVIHPMVVLAMVLLMGILIVMPGQPIEDSTLFIVIIVIIALPMLIICLCINFRGL